MRTEVIVTTYNQPEWLRHCLHAISCQVVQDFDICIADDGSGAETQTVIEEARGRMNGRLRHLWHEDRGFRKTIILNRAIATSTADYLVFLDGDCLPRRDWLGGHVREARPNSYLTGGVIRLNHEVSHRIQAVDIASGACFDPRWLAGNGMTVAFSQRLKMADYGLRLGRFLDRWSPVRTYWNGGHASAWRSDLLRVNGFDESMVYGSEDKEAGLRLSHRGIRGRHVRYSAVLLHLDHARGYATKDGKAANRLILNATRATKRTWTEFGIERRAA